MERFSSNGMQVVALLASAIIVPLLLHVLSMQETSLPSKRLILGVISARDHFSQRQVIRQTWASPLQRLPDVEMKFILGDQDCPIHPDDRINPNGCEMWHVNQDWEGSESKQLFTGHYKESEKNLRGLVKCSIGLGFKVLHPIIIQKFQVRSDILNKSNNTVLILSDPEEVIEQVILSESVWHEERGVSSMKISPLIRLPKGFEGELRLFSLDENEDLCEEAYNLQQKNYWVCAWNNNSVIEYRFIRTERDILTKWHKSSCPLVSAEYVIADKSTLIEHEKQHSQRALKWKQHLTNIQQKVEEEARQQDLLILPHLDVYTNLPHKVMAFLSWTTKNRNSSYVMKVDDDVIVNVNLLNKLTEEPMEDEDQVWWSLFHHRRSVPAYGKWSDFTYPSLTYPTFPAGAGYLMTGTLVRCVVEAQDYLLPHGGEDVSMGIWVSSISDGTTRHVEVPCWLPHHHCTESVLIPQLSHHEIIEVWYNQTNHLT